MSDDLNKKIKQITDILGQENIPDNLKGLLSLLASSGGKEDSSTEREQPGKVEDPHTPKEDKPRRSEMEESIEMVRRIKTIMDRVNTNSDPRINLLSAIKPFLNASRQKRISSCIKLLHVSSLTKYMDEFDKENF